MRQNLTNVSSVDINSVDHFYVVGSTTKEGLIEGKSNVKVDLKDAISAGGEGGGKEAFTSSLKEMLATIPDMVWYPKLDTLWELDEYFNTTNVKVSVGDELTLEELFYADNYDALRIYMYLLTVRNTVPKNADLGSGGYNRILGGTNYNRIYFNGVQRDSPIPYNDFYMMTLVDWPGNYEEVEEGNEDEYFWIHPSNDDSEKIGFFYNRDTETCKVISISQQQ